MKRSIILSMVATMAIMLNAQQLRIQQAPCAMAAPQATSEETLSMEYSYCGDIESQIGWGVAGSIRAVIEVPQEVATRYQGSQITKISAGLGNNAGSDAQIIIFRSLDSDELLYSQSVKFTAQQWNEIVLDTPYTLDGEGFFVGYELTVTKEDAYPVGVDANEANPYGDICALYDIDSQSWVWEHLADYNFGNNCIKFTLSGDNLPKYDLELQDVSIKEYVRTGDYFDIFGTIKNVAAMNISSFEVAVTIGDNAPIMSTITTSIASGETSNFAIEGAVSIEEDGVYDVTVEITSIDGNADENPANNTFTKSVNSMSNLVPRKVLAEEFSTTQCVNCPRAHTIMKEIREGRNDIALVVHHAGYGQDNYTISASRSFLAFYGGSTYAPALMLDRRNLADQGAMGYSGPAEGPVFGITNKDDVQDFINYSLDQPAFVTVNIDDVYNAETRELAVRVYGESVIDLPQTPYINIFVTESGMINYQQGGGNDYEHNHAIRAVLTSTWGDELDITNNQYDVTYTYELSEKWKPENMEVIAFIAHYDGKDINNCNVYNTEYKDLNYDSSAEKIEKDAVNVWAANGKIYIAGTYHQAEVFAIDGRLVTVVEGTTIIDVENNGIYIVNVDGNSYKVIL